jgi:uncharacterized protein YjbJ (UPF0337 family)
MFLELSYKEAIMQQEKTALWNQVEGNWKQLRGEVRKAWGWLTDDEFEEIRGCRDVLAGKIQEHYGIAQEEANRRLDEWVEGLHF